MAKAAELMKHRVLVTGPMIVNRPPGTGKLTDDDFISEFLDMQEHPEKIQKTLATRAQQVGPKQAALEMVEFAERGLKLQEAKNISSPTPVIPEIIPEMLVPEQLSSVAPVAPTPMEVPIAGQ